MPDIAPPPAPVVAPIIVPASDAPSMSSLIQQAADKESGVSKAPDSPKPVAKAAVDPVKPAPAVKKADAPDFKNVGKPTDEPAKTTAAPVKAAPETPKSKLSDTLHRVERENKELKAEVERLKTGKPPEDPEKASIISERDKHKARAAELEENIKYVDYQKSTEFKENFERPYIETYQRLARVAQELTVENEDGSKRTLTESEYAKVVQAGTEDEAIDLATQLFPNHPSKASRLVNMRDAVKTALERLNGALQEYRTKGSEREQQRQSQMSEASKIEKAQYQKEVDALADEFPTYFKNGEDAEENEIREKSTKIVDATLDADKPNLKNVARIRHAAIAHPILKNRLVKALKTIEELTAKVESFEKSVPSGGQPPVGSPTSTEKTFAQKIQEKAT